MDSGRSGTDIQRSKLDLPINGKISIYCTVKIIVIGAGEVGRFLCETLSDDGHDVTVIETSETTAIEVDETQNVKVIEGNGSSAEILKRAGVSDSDFFLAMTSDDQINLLSGSIAKGLGAKCTIARIHDQTYSDNSHFNYQLHLGIDFLLNPEALSAVELAKAIRNPGRVAVENFARGEIEVQQVTVSEKSKLSFKQLRDINLGKMRIGFLQRENNTHVPLADTTLQPGDLLTLVGPPETLLESRHLFEPKDRTDVVRVILFGGSETAIALVRLLKNPRFKVRIIESNQRLCQQLAERFPHITIIHGTATSLRLMEEEQVGSADYFVACTRNDEVNIMTCLQAKKLGAAHVQLVINKPDYEDVLGELKSNLGVELIVAPRKATVDEVMRYLSREPYAVLATMPQNIGKIIEIRVSPNSPCINQEIKHIAFPSGAVIVALLHKFHVKVPGASDKILAGDRVVVITQEEKIKALLKLLT